MNTSAYVKNILLLELDGVLKQLLTTREETDAN
jgi:hypothetical protein